MKFFKEIIDMGALKKQFVNAEPFDHIVIDGLFNKEPLSMLSKMYPKIEDKKWWTYDNFLEKKYAFNSIEQLDPMFKEFFDEVNSQKFIDQLSRLSGVENLIPDHKLNGAGLHQIVRGGKLDVHEDYNIHRELNAFRTLNLIVYLNEDWQEEWGGDLQLWDKDMQNCVKKVNPIFNRSVIFRTDQKSNHGHPDPLNCPQDKTRRSLAIYYYVPMTNEQQIEYKSTQFKKRPQDPLSQEVEELRAKRNKGRVADKIT